MGFFPPLLDLVTQPRAFLVAQAIVFPPLLLMPFVAAYAIFAEGALGVRLLLRAAVRHSLARNTVATLTAIPFVVLVVLLYLNRDQALGDLLVGTDSVALLDGFLTVEAGEVVEGTFGVAGAPAGATTYEYTLIVREDDFVNRIFHTFNGAPIISGDGTVYWRGSRSIGGVTTVGIFSFHGLYAFIHF